MDSRVEKRTILDQSPASSMPVRLWNFVSEMFPIFPVQLSVAGRFVFPYILATVVFVGASPLWLHIIVGGVSMIGFTLLLRVFDELKDYEGDKVNFPDRPLVKGMVTIADLKWASALILLGLIALNLSFAPKESHIIFAIVCIFSLLIFKWFFFEKQIRASLPLALVTHNPVVYLYQIYIFCFLLPQFEQPIYSAFGFLLFEGMAGTAWEVSRKMRVPAEETQYTTYSKIWGMQKATLVLGGLVAVSYLGSFHFIVHFLKGKASFYQSMIWLIPLFGVVWLFNILRLYLKSPAKTPPIRQGLEIYIASTYLAAIIFWLVNI